MTKILKMRAPRLTGIAAATFGLLAFSACSEAENAEVGLAAQEDGAAALTGLADALTGVSCTHPSGRRIRNVAGGGLSVGQGEVAYVHERTPTAAFDDNASGGWERVDARFAIDVEDGVLFADRALGDCHVVEAFCGTGECVSIAVSGAGRDYQRYANRIEIFISKPGEADRVKGVLTRLMNAAGPAAAKAGPLASEQGE